MKLPRFARLLPGVVVIGAALLALKTTDLVHAAYAQVSGQVAALTNDPVPANKDYAGGEDDQVASASEVDVMNGLSKRRRELDVRDTQLNTQANMIAAAEARVDAKITQLQKLKDQINALLVQRDDTQKKQIESLIKTYGPDGMKPAKAAAIFNTLPDEVLIPVAQGLKPGDLGAILAQMNPDAAQRLTVKLANKLTLPQTADATAPAPLPAQTAATPAPGPQAAAAKPAAAPAAPEKQAPPNG
jgi:flagellar motility protein MotE (MotC chaperone)